jgi:mono/diheme cytochrome c family protein
VLGFTALQLSTDRDPAALHADPPAAAGIDLRWLLEHDRLRSLPPELAAAPPRIAASTPRERAVLGYLYANCAGCHNARGPLADLGLSLDIAADGSAELFESALGRTARWRPYGAPESIRVVAGDPEASLLLRRVASRQPLLQMPPLSTHAVDQAAADLIRAWIREELVARAAADPDPRTAAPGAALEQEEP